MKRNKEMVKRNIKEMFHTCQEQYEGMMLD